MVGFRPIGILTGFGNLRLTVDIPSQLRRILFVEVNAHFRIGFAVWSALGESGTLEIFGFIIMERVCVEMTVPG